MIKGINGMSVNGVHSRNFPIIINKVKRPVLPTVRQQYEVVPGRDGAYDYSDGSLEDAIVSVEITLIADELSNKRHEVRRIAQWLYGTGSKVRIIFDDEPDKYYYGRIANQIDPEELATIGEFELQFRCDPVAYTIDETTLETIITTSPYKTNIRSEGTRETPPVFILTNEGSNTIRSFTIMSENLAN